MSLAPLAPEPISTPAHRENLEVRRTALREQLHALLPPSSSFVWELGCGHGHFLTAFAQAHPETLCVGIDVVGERIERALRKRDRARLANLHFIRAEANFFLATLPPTARIEQIFALFPDPWPKQRHHKHRIIQPNFLSHAALHTTVGGQLCFRTDFRPYFEHAKSCVARHPAWQLTDEPWPFEFETVFQHRAVHYQSLTARRAASPTPEP